ncbi:MAG: hypothetical protein KAV87_17475 [Desulfobacteraceae bacterium]|nr:hypothetical protein [Desulfobacteraceae bacterium]
MKEYSNVAESYPLYDTVIICSELYGKEKSLNGWFTNFRDFANNERHTFFKDRTIGNSHLAYCNMDSADNVDFVYKVFSVGVRFFAPVCPDAKDVPLISPGVMNENVPPFWLFDLPKHCGFDFKVQQDTIVENTCLATPPGYGPRIGGGAQPAVDDQAPFPNQTPWKLITGTNGEPIIDNRFTFPTPISIPRNATIEANVYPSIYARFILGQLLGPNSTVLPTEEQATTTPGDDDWLSIPTRYGIQVSLYGYREVQQRGQYHSPGGLRKD